MPRWDAKVDDNQRELVRGLRKLGRTVLDLSRVGKGCPDLLVGFRGKNTLLEVKGEKGKLRPSQVDFIETWGGREVRVVRNLEEAIEATK